MKPISFKRHRFPADVIALSDRFCALRISGTGATKLLAAGTGLDLRPPAFGIGYCARSLWAEETIAIFQQLSDAPDFRVLVDAGLASWVVDWMLDTAGVLGL